jgi:hypothetical protein
VNDAKPQAATPPTPPLIEVTLAKPHTHAGKRHDAGAKIHVNEIDRERLVRKGIVIAKEKAR